MTPRHALLLLVFAASVYAGKVSVGPYYLGMSAAEARKVGIADCKPWGRSTKCAATYGPLKDSTGFSLLLDSRAQAVKSIELKTERRLGKPDTQADFKPEIVCLYAQLGSMEETAASTHLTS